MHLKQEKAGRVHLKQDKAGRAVKTGESRARTHAVRSSPTTRSLAWPENEKPTKAGESRKMMLASLCHENRFFCSACPSEVGKNGPSSDMRPPARLEQPGPPLSHSTSGRCAGLLSASTNT